MGMYFRPSAPFTGGTVSGDTNFLGSLSAGTIYSGTTNIYGIFATTGDTSYLQNEINQLILDASGYTPLTTFSSYTSTTNNTLNYLQGEINELSGGTSAFTLNTVFSAYTTLTTNQLNTKANLSGATFDGQIETPSLSATTITGTNIFGEGSNITGINFSQLATTAHTHPISDVVNLQSNLDSKIDKPINPFLGEYLYYNGITWVPNQLNIPVAAGAGVTLFLSITGSTLPGYEYLSDFPIEKNEVEEQVIVNNSQQLIGKYATNPLKRNVIDPGIWEFNIYASTDAASSGLTQIITSARLLTTGGSETFLFSAATENITSTAATLYTISVVENQFSCNTTDYLVINYSGATDNNFNTKVSLYHGGSVNYSHIHTPFRTLHNDLAGLQGGQFDEYYHLSKTQAELLTTNVDASSIHNHDSLYLSLGGGVVSGNTEFTQELSANTIFSAGTNLIDIFAPIVHTHPQYATLSGATFNGQVEAPSLSGTTLSGETIFSGSTDLYNIFSTTDYFTTGSTFDNNLKIATFNRNDGQTYQLNLSALSTVDTYVTGFTYNNNTFTIKQNEGIPDLSATINSVTGLTVNGNLTVTGNTSLQGLTANTISATTYQNLPVTADTFVTGFTFGSNILTIKQNNNKPDISATISTIDLSPALSAATFNIATTGSISASSYIGLPKDVFVTGGTYTGTTIIFTNNTGGTFSVTGITGGGGGGSGSTVSGDYLPLSGGTVTGATIFTSGVTSNTAVFSSSTNNVVNIIGSGSTAPIFRVQGSQGELFAVTDSLTGSLFSINDISGLPIFEVFSDNTVLMGSYFAPSLNTTARVTANIGTTNIYSIPTSAYTGAFFDYTVNNATSARAGTVMSVFSGSSVQFTETSTLDIGNTSGITFSVAISSGNAIFIASATTNSWTVKTIVRSV